MKERWWPVVAVALLAVLAVEGMWMTFSMRGAARHEREELVARMDELLEKHRSLLTEDVERIVATEINRGLDRALSPNTFRQGTMSGLRGLGGLVEDILVPPQSEAPAEADDDFMEDVLGPR